jgi:hypothetical protein
MRGVERIVLIALVLAVTALAVEPVLAGCCIQTPGGNAVFNPNINDEEDCDNLHGQLSTENQCVASNADAGKIKVMPDDTP